MKSTVSQQTHLLKFVAHGNRELGKKFRRKRRANKILYEGRSKDCSHVSFVKITQMPCFWKWYQETHQSINKSIISIFAHGASKLTETSEYTFDFLRIKRVLFSSNKIQNINNINYCIIK